MLINFARKKSISNKPNFDHKITKNEASVKYKN